MSGDRKRIKEVFFAAADLDGSERKTFLDQACGQDDELRGEVESLLAHDHDDEDAFGESELGIGRELLGEALATGAESGTGAPSKVGRYRVLRKIGAGGMGTVYEAQQDQPHRRVALKMIRRGAMSRGLMRRFRQEAELLGRLQHPGIAQIYEAGAIETDSGRQPYFAMEYVDGEELRRYAERHGLGTRERLELVARVCDAVHHAHQKGIVHRDLKPDNVLVVEEPAATSVGGDTRFAQLGQPKVLDFGVARATDSDIQVTTVQTDVGQLIGTVPYMSPEQVAGDSREVDTRTDIYALGVLMYELLSGRLPFDLRHKPVPEAARIIREDEPTRLSSIRTIFRGDIDTIATKALEKDPQRRYQSAAAMAADIRRYLANEPITARPPSTFYQLGKFARRNRGLVAGLVLSLLILVAGIVSSLTFAVRAARERRLAAENERRAVLSEAGARGLAYRANLTAAEAVGDTDPILALQQLESAPPEYRGWEWRHLSARLDARIASYQAERPVGRYASTVARRADGLLTGARPRGDGIELIDLESGEAVAVFSDGDGVLTAPCLSPSGTHLATLLSPKGRLDAEDGEATTGKDKFVVWDTATGKRLLEIPAGPIDAQYTRFSPDGSLVATLLNDGSHTIRETSTGSVRSHTPLDLPSSTKFTVFDREAKRVAIAAYSRSRELTLTVNSIAGERLASRVLVDGVRSLAFSPDGALLAVGQYEERILLLDSSTLEISRALYGHKTSVTGLAFSSDGSYLASSSSDGTTRIWEVSAGDTLRVFVGGNAKSLAFSGDNALLAGGAADGLRVWSWRQDARLVLRGHESYVYCAAFSPEPGEPGLIASSAWDNTVRLWDALTGDPLAVLSASSPFEAMAFTPDGTRLLAHDGKDPYRFAVWDPATGARLTSPRMASDIALFETLKSTETSWPEHFSQITRGDHRRYRLFMSPDGSLMARRDETGLQVINVATNEQVFHLDKLTKAHSSLAFSSDGTLLATCFEELGPTVWDIAGGAKLASLSGHIGDVYGFAFSPDGSRLVTGGDDGNIMLWDTESFERVAVLPGHKAYVHAVGFSPDGTMLVSASGDGTVRVWDSVPPGNRRRNLQRLKQLRREAELMVDRLLDELGDPLTVADHLRADTALTNSLRQAALRVLLRGSTAGRPTG